MLLNELCDHFLDNFSDVELILLNEQNDNFPNNIITDSKEKLYNI